MTPNNPAESGTQQIPQISEEQVERAWEAYETICKVQHAIPRLLDNEYFEALREAAFARFMIAFEAMP